MKTRTVRVSVAATTLVVCLLAGTAAWGANAGSLDVTFGTGGMSVTSIGSGNDLPRAVALQSDGKVVAGGTATSNDGASQSWVVARYNADGSLDTSFELDGTAITWMGTCCAGVSAVTVQADGKILAAGWYLDTEGNRAALARYNADGSLDLTFGVAGVVKSVYGPVISESNAVAVQADGRIVVAGWSFGDVGRRFALARYNADGSLDAAFGTGGQVAVAVGSDDDVANAMAIQPDGRIVAAGSTYSPTGQDFALIRLNTDGTLDPTFGNGGKATSGSSCCDVANALAIQPDGRIVAAGSSHGRRDIVQLTLARYNTDGSPDATFGNNGRVVTRTAGSANGVALQADGRIVAAGDVSYLARYDVDGTLDAGFGTGGKVGGGSALAAVIQPDGRIVAVGPFSDGGDLDFAVARYTAAATPSTTTSLSILAPARVRKNARANIHGVLSSTDPACMASQRVYLDKGTATPMGSKLTDATGAYSFRPRIRAQTVVKVVFQGNSACDPSSSAVRTIRVT